MWNEKTKPLVEAGKLVVIGIVQEQHAQRAKLYKQWKKYDFPIAQDALTSLGLAVVPVPILLDEYGFVIESKLKPSNIAELVNKKSPNVEKPKAGTLNVESLATANLSTQPNIDSAKPQIAIGDRFFFKHTQESLESSIDCYQRAIELASKSEGSRSVLAAAHFRLGVAYRTLYDMSESNEQDPEHFSLAAKHWTKALSLNPNQYIWRRRIQQYGPRQIKPYPFYNWVDTAISEIKSRGETPVELHVSLTQAEVAMPQRKFESSADPVSPDPNGEIMQDVDEVINEHVTVVPQSVKAGGTVRVHMRFATVNGHWNNEADPMVVWFEPSDQGKFSTSLTSAKGASTSTSDEVRNLEVEFQTSSKAKGPIRLKGYALYYACKDDGQCLYLRKDLSVSIEIDQNN